MLRWGTASVASGSKSASRPHATRRSCRRQDGRDGRQLGIRRQDHEVEVLGAQVDEVDEHQSDRTVVCVEFEEYPEPKVLSSDELQTLYGRFKSFYKVADAIGTSEAFARQAAKLERFKI